MPGQDSSVRQGDQDCAGQFRRVGLMDGFLFFVRDHENAAHESFYRRVGNGPVSELFDADHAVDEHGGTAVLEAEFAAIGRFRVSVVDQVVGDFIDADLDSLDLLRLQVLFVPQGLQGVEGGVGVLAAGVRLERIIIDFQTATGKPFRQLSRWGVADMARQNPFPLPGSATPP